MEFTYMSVWVWQELASVHPSVNKMTIVIARGSEHALVRVESWSEVLSLVAIVRPSLVKVCSLQARDLWAEQEVANG